MLERKREREKESKGSYQTKPTATVNKIVEISSCAKRDLFDVFGST